jgi:hypothetical protein
VDAKVVGRKDEAPRWMLGDDLEAIPFRDLQDLNHCAIQHFPDSLAVVGRLTFYKIDSSEWHDQCPLRN